MCRLWHQALAWLCVVLLPKPGLSAGSSSAFDTPAPPPPVIDMFADCPQGGCKRMVVTRKDYRECEPVRLRLVGKPMCVEAGQQITYPPCLEDQGCLSLYCPSQTDWPLVCPVADSIRSHKDKGSNLVSFTLFDDTKAVLGQCPRRRHFGFYTVFDEEDIRSGTGGFMWDIQHADTFTESCQGHTLPSCTLFSKSFGGELYIYNSYPQTYELIHPKIKGVHGELLRYRWLQLASSSLSLPKNNVTSIYQDAVPLRTFNTSDQIVIDEGYRGAQTFAMTDPVIEQVVLPQWQPGSVTALNFKCNTTGIFARNSSYINGLAGEYSGCCILEIRLHSVAMKRERLCATFARSSDAKLVGLDVTLPQLGTTTPVAVVDGTTSYSVTVPSTATAISITARQSSPFASLTLYYLAFGSTLTSGTPSHTLGLGEPGTSRAWNIRVTAEDGTLIIYTLSITRSS